MASEGTKSYRPRRGFCLFTQKCYHGADVRGGVKTPPYRARETGNEPGTPRGAHPCREAYMPPLQTPGTAYTNQIRFHRANVRGPHACGPYRPAGNGRRMGKEGVCRVPSAAGSRPRPTDHPGTTNKQVNQTATAGVNAHPAERRERPVQWRGVHGRI